MYNHNNITAALINCNLRKEALAHCIKIGNCSAVVFSPSLSQALAKALPELDPTIHDNCFSYGEQSVLPRARNMEEEVKTASSNDPPHVDAKQATGELLREKQTLDCSHLSHKRIKFRSTEKPLKKGHIGDGRFVLCREVVPFSEVVHVSNETSGTTELPKACNTKHTKHYSLQQGVKILQLTFTYSILVSCPDATSSKRGKRVW